MNVVYYVIKQEPCPTCLGNETVIHPLWSAFWEFFYDDENPDIPDVSDIDEWFTHHGYDYPPDEEIPCPECDGAGFIRREVEISEVLQFIEDRLENLESYAMHEVNS